MKQIRLLALLLIVGLSMMLFAGCGSEPAATSAPTATPAATPTTDSGGYGYDTPTASAVTPTATTSGGANAQNVSMDKVAGGYAFSPTTLTIKVGTTVTWTNESTAPHMIESDDGKSFKSDAISSGQSYSFTFKQAGTYAYHCDFHPSMKATIIVQ